MRPLLSAPLLARTKAAFPAVAFFGGFLWDALTLGRAVTTLDLWMLLGYLAVAAALLVFMGRRGRLRGAEPLAAAPAASETLSAGIPGDPADAPPGLPAKLLAWLRADGPAFFLQFCFGSLFSALFILYFRSSSYLPGFLVVLVLLGLLVANEFLEDQYHRFTLTWALFGTCCILYLNFAVPHVAGSIHAFWFFLSTAAGTGLAYGAKRLCPRARGSLWPTYAVALVLCGLYLANAIPPVPLVKKNAAICRNLERRDGAYTAAIEVPPLWAFWRGTETRVRQRPGEKIFCFSSVFAPAGLHATLYHRWRHKAPGKGWTDASRIGFPIAGGRAGGFRGYTYKRNLAPGAWEVRLETEAGRVLGSIRFRCEASADTAMALREIVLD